MSMRSAGRRAALIFYALALALAAQPALAGSYLAALRDLSRQARVTALVVRLPDMKTIASINPDLRLTPASVSKLFAASAALQQFGPEHRFVSRLARRGTIRGHTLDGDLIFVGGGDPELDTPHLRILAARLRAAGVTRVTGDLIVDDSLWGTVPCLTVDRCRARLKASHAYSAPLSAAGVNFGTIGMSLYPGESARSATRVVFAPHDLPGYTLDNQVKTVAGNRRPRLRVWRTYDEGRNTLHLRGTVPAGGGPYRVHRAVTGASAETARVLSALLIHSGIHVAGKVRTATLENSGADPVLARVKSRTLAEQLIPMMAYSSNYMADTLTLDVAADSQYNKPLTLPTASQSLEALGEHALEEIYPDRADDGSAPVFDSGSGLATSNKISARDVIALLAYMYKRNELFPAFYGSLPVPLSAPSRTLKRGDFDFLTRLTAKTGTLTEPVTVRALGGYFRFSDGRFGAYAFIINGTARHPDLTYHQTVTAYQHDMETILAHY